MVPQGFTISALAVEFRIDRRTIAKRIGDLKPMGERDGAKIYSLADVFRVLAASNADTGPEAAERLRWMKTRADRAALAYRKSLGQLIDVDEMIPVVTAIVMRMKQRMLAIPVKAAPLVAVELEIEPCRAVIETLIHEALAELASTDPRLVGVVWDGVTDGADKSKEKVK
jgi:hypothetical protein